MIGTTSTQEKIDWLLSLPSGATHVANYKTQDFSQVVREVTQGEGANVVIDFVGKTHFQKNLDSMALDGRMTMLALLSGMFNMDWVIVPLTSTTARCFRRFSRSLTDSF